MDTFWEDLQSLYDKEHEKVTENMTPIDENAMKEEQEDYEELEVPF